MRELLERWAEREPEGLEVGPLGVYLRPPVNSSMAWPEVKHEVIPDGILLAAVIEAIEARDWWLQAGRRDSEFGKYAANVELRESPYLAVGWGATFTEAVLSAYLAAMEVEK